MSILERGVSFLRNPEQKRIERDRRTELPHIRIRQHLRDGGSLVFQFGDSEPVTIEGTDPHSEVWGNVIESLHNNRKGALHLRLLDAEGDEQKSFREDHQPRDLVKEIWQSLTWN